MSVTYQGPIRINRRQNATFDGSAPVNSSGLTLGNNVGAVTASQEFYIFQSVATAGNQALYEVGVGGTAYVGGQISIPNVGVAAAQVIATIPAGARIQNVNLNLLQAPTAITGGAMNFAINGTNIGSISISAGLGNGTIAWATALAGLRAAAYVGNTDAVLTASLAGTGITGGILAEFTVLYTVRNADGSLNQSGAGQSF